MFHLSRSFYMQLGGENSVYHMVFVVGLDLYPCGVLLGPLFFNN